MDNYTGKRIDGRYEIQEVIGVGGMAVVYKAYDSIDDRIVAIKILKDEYLANEEFRRRFKNESKAIAVLSHPNIVKVLNVNYGDKLQYIVMEYVEGITLKEYIEQQGRLGIKETVHFTMQILRALQHAHDKGIVHRDIKPQNIMLLSNGNIKVTDFGIARFSYSDTKTMTDSAIGSVHYISPEQARGDATDDRADIYSVGVVMYEMLTGQLPFQSENSVSVALMQLQSDPKRPRELNSSIPIGLEQIVMHAMQKNANDRYQSAAEMLLDIEEFKRNPAIRFQQNYFVDNDPTKYVGRKQDLANAKIPPAVNRTSQRTERLTQPEPSAPDDYDQDNSAGNSRTKLIVIGTAIGLAVVALIVFASLFFFTDVFKGDTLTVPQLTGLNVNEVVDNAKYKDFKITVEKVANSSYSDGIICNQRPTSGTKVTPDKNEITISVATTYEKKVVNDVYGLMYEQARKMLESQGFVVDGQPIVSMSEAFGTVIRTDPERNTEAESGSKIIIYYASDKDLIPVPSVVGMDLEMAKALIESANLVVDENVKSENSDKPAGQVIDQSPANSEKVISGSKVTLTVSNGVPAISSASFSIVLPSTGTRGTFEIFVSNESYVNKTLLLDGSSYEVKIEGSGNDAPVKIYIDNKEYYSCRVDFTKNPAVVSGGAYSNSNSVLSKKPIPDVRGLSLEQAKQRLNAEGFNNIKIEGVTVYTDAENGMVKNQSPSPASTGIFGTASTYFTDTEIILTVGQKDGV